MAQSDDKVPAAQPDEAKPEPSGNGEQPAKKFNKSAVLRDFRQSLSAPHAHDGSKRRKPVGGNPRFR